MKTKPSDSISMKGAGVLAEKTSLFSR